jgi:hypothetical protein
MALGAQRRVSHGRPASWPPPYCFLDNRYHQPHRAQVTSKRILIERLFNVSQNCMQICFDQESWAATQFNTSASINPLLRRGQSDYPSCSSRASSLLEQHIRYWEPRLIISIETVAKQDESELGIDDQLISMCSSEVTRIRLPTAYYWPVSEAFALLSDVAEPQPLVFRSSVSQSS